MSVLGEIRYVAERIIPTGTVGATAMRLSVNGGDKPYFFSYTSLSIARYKRDILKTQVLLDTLIFSATPIVIGLVDVLTEGHPTPGNMAALGYGTVKMADALMARAIISSIDRILNRERGLGDFRGPTRRENEEYDKLINRHRHN